MNRLLNSWAFRSAPALLILVAVTVLASCDALDKVPSFSTRMKTENVKVIAESGYVQDPRTGLCFLVNSPHSNAQSIAGVTCTPEVLREIAR